MKALFWFIVLCVLCRFIIMMGPAWANFSPLGAMCLFAGHHFKPKAAIVASFLGVWLSNLMLDNILYSEWYNGFSWAINPHMFIFILITLLGVSRMNIWMGLGVGAIGFFLLSNYLVYLNSSYNSLLDCYIAGLPFLKNTIISNYLFGSIMYLFIFKHNFFAKSSIIH